MSKTNTTPTPIDVRVALIDDEPGPGWDTLWQRLLRPLPDDPLEPKERTNDQ